LTDKKVFDFTDDFSGENCELWDNLSASPTLMIQGVAHSYVQDDCLILTLFSGTGVLGTQGEIKTVVGRFALSKTRAETFLEQIRESIELFETESTPKNASEQPSTGEVLGDRIG
jgi:hypothetical protein